MNEQLYRDFLEHRHLDKKRARLALTEFIASFEGAAEQETWAREFLERGDYGHKIRHEIYRELIFPLLLRGFQNDDAWSLYQLSRTIQNVYDVEEFWQQIGYATDLDLLKQSYLLSPADAVRRELLHRTIQWFDYCQHEWPSGILFGNDGASPDQCRQILAEASWARGLDEERNYAVYLADFESKVRQHQQRLAN